MTQRFVENPGWKGMPFFLTSGKALREKRIGISLRFLAKEPGARVRLRAASLDFDHAEGFARPLPAP